MCKNHNPRKIDKCMKELIEILQCRGVKTLACCCGHKKYPMTIVILQGLETDPYAFEIISQQVIPRKKRFYSKDKQGYYFIPESVEYWRNAEK